MQWKPLWHYQTIDHHTALMDFRENVQELRFRPMVSGIKVRLLLDNRYNSGKMVIDGIRIVHTDGRESIITTAGEEEVTLQPGELRYTDEVNFEIAAGEDLSVRIAICCAEGMRSMCQCWTDDTWQSYFCPYADLVTGYGSTDAVPFLKNKLYFPNIMIGLSQIDIYTDDSVRTLAFFGDSITHMSFYSDAVIGRLMKEYPGLVTAVNTGISGNRLCYEATYIPDRPGEGKAFGGAGFRRFENDVFGTMQPDYVLLLEGVNDICQCFKYNYPHEIPNVELFAERCSEIISCAHRHGAKIFISPILPETHFEQETWFGECERLRQEINAWIRTQTFADGIIDFESVLTENGRLKDGITMDGLHPNTLGGKLMASAVDLSKILG